MKSYNSTDYKTNKFYKDRERGDYEKNDHSNYYQRRNKTDVRSSGFDYHRN
jgi:hypothetical protein